MRMGVKAIIWSFLVLWLSACSASNQDKVDNLPEVSILAADRFCGNKSGVSLITSPQQDASLPMVVNQTLANAKLDWSKFQILRINMGQQPNMGYSLGYQGGAKVIGSVLIIPVQWNRPQPGMMYAQMLVEPCLLLSIPRQVYERIQVIDQDGRTRWTLSDLNQ